MNENHVLVVDDDDVLREQVKRILNRHNYKVTLAKNGIMALKELQEQKGISVIILDLMMPQISGEDFLYIEAKMTHLRIIVLTAHPDRLSDVDAEKSNVFYYLTKPFDDNPLLFSVRAAFKDLEKNRQLESNYDSDSGGGRITEKPSVFIGSSLEGHEIAEYIQSGLDRVADSQIWSQGVFGLTAGNLESLVKAASSFDFAVLILTQDDLTIKRAQANNTPRDNVLFELGLFIGAIGRDKTFIVYNRDRKPELPSDLAGVTVASFGDPGDRKDKNWRAALGPVCLQLKEAMGLI